MISGRVAISAFVLLGVSMSGSARGQTAEIETVLRHCPRGWIGCAEDGLRKVHISDVRVSGDYARASLLPPDAGTGEGAISYLKRVDGKWVIVVEGSGVDPNDFDIPKAVIDEFGTVDTRPTK